MSEADSGTVELLLARLADTEALGRRVAGLLRPGDSVLLEGPLGAGKSTLARALLRALCRDPAMEVPSPTFTLVQEYESPLGPVSHFDLWRLDGPAGLPELGWEEAREGVVLVEWPDRLQSLRPDDALAIGLAPVADDADSRSVTIGGWPGRRDALLALPPGAPAG